MVPVPSRCTVDGKPLATLLPADKIEELVVRTRNGGAEVVALLKTGSAYYAPSAAAARMAKAVIEDSGAVMPVCAWVDGEYGLSGAYLGVEAEIGKGGIKKIVETAKSGDFAAAAKDGDDRQKDVASRLLGGWMTADAAPVLLDLSKSLTEDKYRGRAIRGFLRIARQFKLEQAERAKMAKDAWGEAKNAAEEGSPGTRTSRARMAAPGTSVATVPSLRTSTPRARIIRSVWSRESTGSCTSTGTPAQ